ncbi:MAG: 30S ribosome-binding factor RbfA [Opitutaceae bacterium]|jgi:ribosome-binding factor A
MSNRTLRINELIQRELSDILRRRYQSEAVAVTITEVRVAPDLRDARVFVSVIGSETVAQEKLRWLREIDQELRHELGRRIVIKYMPRLNYVHDRSTVQSGRILQVLDELEAKKKIPDA